jgi:hypothetical protein
LIITNRFPIGRPVFFAEVEKCAAGEIRIGSP